MKIACAPIKKTKRALKINDQIKHNIYTWITSHTQVVLSQSYNDCLKVIFDNQTELQLVPKFLLQVSVRELHNNLVIDTNDGSIKDSRDEDDNIIISDSTLRSLLPPQLKQISARYKVRCGCKCCIYAKIIHSSLLSWRDWYLKNQGSKQKRSKHKV